MFAERSGNDAIAIKIFTISTTTNNQQSSQSMSRSKLSNTELKFYNTSGESDVVYAKLKGTSQNSLILEGASGATKVSLQNVADPTGTGQVATWDYVNTKVNELNNGLSWKAPVRAKSTANVAGSLSGNVFTCTSNGQ